jgi:quinol-cytochrome oxidoreductase complex cytochrome b subunit
MKSPGDLDAILRHPCRHSAGARDRLLHLFLVQKHGMSRPPSVEGSGEGKRSMPFFPNFFLRDLVGWLCALGVLAALAAYFPAELGKKADPFQPAPIGIKPEWYFMAMFQTLKLLPAHILGIEVSYWGVLDSASSG